MRLPGAMIITDYLLLEAIQRRTGANIIRNKSSVKWQHKIEWNPWKIVKATVVLAPEYKDKAGKDLVKELQNHVKQETAPYKYPRIIEFTDELPKTISGKIRRVDIRNKE